MMLETRMEATVQELLTAVQAPADRKAKLDMGWVDSDSAFNAGDRMLLPNKELLDAKLCPRWDGPFTVTTCPSPNAYIFALPHRQECTAA
jgi:hypothetical protein